MITFRDDMLCLVEGAFYVSSYEPKQLDEVGPQLFHCTDEETEKQREPVQGYRPVSGRVRI